MGLMNANQLIAIAVQVALVMVATVFHEVAHAATANALGDPTAKEQGRLTLNPLAHLDLVGSFVLPLLMALVGGPVFAFAKPVPYNPNRLRKPVRDEVLVALAGPFCNLVQAGIGAIAFRIVMSMAQASVANETIIVVLQLLATYVTINLVLMFFNLIPLPPLDGSTIISPLLRGKARDWYYIVQRNAMPVLLAIMFLIPMVFHFNPISMYLDVTAGPLADLFLGY